MINTRNAFIGIQVGLLSALLMLTGCGKMAEATSSAASSTVADATVAGVDLVWTSHYEVSTNRLTIQVINPTDAPTTITFPFAGISSRVFYYGAANEALGSDQTGMISVLWPVELSPNNPYSQSFDHLVVPSGTTKIKLVISYYVSEKVNLVETELWITL
jgi:hypothetical protein